ATMASGEFDESKAANRPTVQVGDPFMEKLLLEACLEIFKEDLLEGIQDMGAAGLTSSSTEMCARAGTGLELDLDMIPRRAQNLHPYEILLSESQERMLLVAKKGREARVLEICKKWELDAVVIGRVTDTQRWVVKATPGRDPLDRNAPPARPVVVCDIPVDVLVESAPKYDRPRKADAQLPRRKAIDALALAPVPEGPQALSDELLALCGSPNLGSRRWIWRQYDHMVRGGTMVRPGSDAAIVRVPCERDDGSLPAGKEFKYLALSVDCDGRMCELDARNGAAMAVAECARNVVVSGGEPIGLTDCLNFGNPERPEVMQQLSDAIDGIADACKALGVPVVSGNVSLYNETVDKSGKPRGILPTPTVAIVGLVADPADIVTAHLDLAVGVAPSHADASGAARPEDCALLLLGPQGKGAMGGSEYVARHSPEVVGEPPMLDLEAEARLQKLVLSLARAHVLRAAHDVSGGGLGVALAEMCTTGVRDVGVEVALSRNAKANGRET
ncbi:MAG: AIR synthase-related protein, partial [Polyangiales bacterium]